MLKELLTRIKLTADEGKVITNGTNIYVQEITLGVGVTDEGFYEIPKEEYEAMIIAETEKSGVIADET